MKKDYFEPDERFRYDNLTKVIPILEILRDMIKEVATGLK